MPILHTLP
ncbi:hypothetical protein D021_1024A, partial [Vibrio parahaemolyticus 10296]